MQKISGEIGLVTLAHRKDTEDLDPDQKAELVALVWIGREDYVAEDWYAALDEARRNSTPFTAEYLLSKPQMAEFLEEGLNKLGYYCS